MGLGGRLWKELAARPEQIFLNVLIDHMCPAVVDDSRTLCKGGGGAMGVVEGGNCIHLDQLILDRDAREDVVTHLFFGAWLPCSEDFEKQCSFS